MHLVAKLWEETSLIPNTLVQYPGYFTRPWLRLGHAQGGCEVMTTLLCHQTAKHAVTNASTEGNSEDEAL